MKSYTNIALITSFIALWLVSFFSEQYQIIGGFVLILTFGILHGSNDIELLTKITVTKNNTFTWRTPVYYVLFIALGAVLFYIIPPLALVSFILVSSYHFGEQQWQNLPSKSRNWLKQLYQFLSGFIILLLIFVFHQQQVQEIIF